MILVDNAIGTPRRTAGSVSRSGPMAAGRHSSSKTKGRGSAPRTCPTSSNGSTERRVRPVAGPASVSRSQPGSSIATAAGSRRRTGSKAAPGSWSGCPARRSAQGGRGARPRDQVAGQTLGPDQAVVIGDRRAPRGRGGSRPRARPAGPITKAAVAYASTNPRRGPTTVRLRNPRAGCPVRGSTMWSPRSYVPDVATAPSRTARTAATLSGWSGWRMPTRQRCPGTPRRARPRRRRR